MTSTAERLAAAAAALVEVIATGHQDMTDPRDLVITAQARDQALACLTVSHRYLFAGLGHTVDLTAQDFIRHPMLGLGEALRKRPATGLAGPSPTDIALDPPSHPTARAWAALARELDAATVEITRARPDNPSWAWQWAGLAPQRPDGQPPAGSPNVAWGLAADLCALAAGVAAADHDLAVALHQGGDQFAAAHRALADQSLTDLQTVAGIAQRIAEAGPLPEDYHLPVAAPGLQPLIPTTTADLAPALHRAGELALNGPPLTVPQHFALAAAAATCSAALARATPGALESPLLELAHAAKNYAMVWGSSKLFALEAGSWAPAEQVRAVNAFLSTSTRSGRLDRSTAVQTDLVAAARQLPRLLQAAAGNVRLAIQTNAYLAVDHVGDPRRLIVGRIAVHPERRRYQRAADQVTTVAEEARLRMKPLPSSASRVTSALARDLLTAAAQSTSRPAHPALPPPVLRPLPARRISRS
ncbi:hypothetical protein [Kineosporia sp. A_224]|uniref:hypothetical protein n=1 Tax=Kineosporia sp. A_224 TaxID=1962180 RepID=UPI000B4A8B02|nr:hypothetical protein [Kineosporia sp. A_224]